MLKYKIDDEKQKIIIYARNVEEEVTPKAIIELNKKITLPDYNFEIQKIM